MYPDKWVARHPYFVFLAALLLGMVFSAIGVRALQLTKGRVPNPCDHFDDREKIVMSEEQDMSKWLLSLASGALAAALATRISDKTSSDTPAAMTAYALLIVSMFGAYLSHDNRMRIATVGPPDYVYSPGFLWPTRIQFWSLILGIAMLGWSVFKPRKVAAAVVLLAAFLILPSARAETFDRKACVSGWFSAHFPNSAADPSIAVKFVDAFDQKASKSPPLPADYDDKNKEKVNATMHTPAGISACDDIGRLLDRTRAYNIAETQADSVEGINSYMKSLLPTVDGSNMTSSDVVVSLMSVLAPWIRSFGVLYVNLGDDLASKAGVTYTVTLDGRLFGNASCHDRVGSGRDHNLIITSSANMKPLYANAQFTIADGENKVMTISGNGVK